MSRLDSKLEINYKIKKSKFIIMIYLFHFKSKPKLIISQIVARKQ